MTHLDRPKRAALIVRAPGSARTLLGLGVGERVLLALAQGGVLRVAFAGDGPTPSCPRAPIEEALAHELGAAFVLPADLVFDRGLLADPEALGDDQPLAWREGEALAAIVADPAGWLAEKGEGQAQSGRGFALRVTDDAAAKRARRALLLCLRKPIDGFVSRHLNRHVSTFISSLLVGTGVSPNVLTILFLGVGLVGAYFAAMAEPWWALLAAGFLFQAQSILDGCDGEIARLTYRFSKSGQWLDSIGDDLTNYSFCLGLALGQARVLEAPWLYTAGFVVLGCQLLAAGVCYRRLILLGTGDLLAIQDLTTTAGGDGLWGRFLTFARLISKRDVFVFIIATMTALQMPFEAFCAFGIGTVLTVYGVLLNDIRIARLARERA